MKLLVWDRSGFVIWGKRLERGTFELPRDWEAGASVALSWEELVLIVYFHHIMAAVVQVFQCLFYGALRTSSFSEPITVRAERGVIQPI